MSTSRRFPLFAASFLLTAAGPSIKVAVIDHGQVSLMTATGQLEAITASSTLKSNPTWSPDGDKIAYLEEVPKEVALAKLVVIDTSGHPLFHALVHPVVPGVSSDGLRYAEYITWVADNKVLVGGDLNPSTGEYMLFDLNKSTPVQDIMVDGQNVAASPDGRHIASTQGWVHFESASTQADAAVVDDAAIPLPAGRSYYFRDKPVWSLDSRSVALLSYNGPEAPIDSETVLILNGLKEVSVIPVGVLGGNSASLSWDAQGNVYLALDGDAPGKPARAYVISHGSHSLVPVSPKDTPGESAGSMRSALTQGLRARGYADVSIWDSSDPHQIGVARRF